MTKNKNMKKKIALVLGSGGARGIAHIGVIREFIEQGFEITSVAGASMGALVGGIYAAGKLDEYEEWVTSLSKRDIFNLVDLTLSPKGIIKADKVLKEIKRFVSDKKIEDLPVDFVAVATDLSKSEEVVMTEGLLYEAIRASISIPMLITPVQKNDALFVDGGVLNPVPVNRIARKEGDMLVAVNVNARIPFEKKAKKNQEWNWFDKQNSVNLNGFQKLLSGNGSNGRKNGLGYFTLLTQTSSLMLWQIMNLTFRITPPDLVIEVSRDVCGIFDFHKAAELIEIGRSATKAAIERYLTVDMNSGIR